MTAKDHDHHGPCTGSWYHDRHVAGILTNRRIAWLKIRAFLAVFISKVHHRGAHVRNPLEKDSLIQEASACMGCRVRADAVNRG